MRYAKSQAVFWIVLVACGLFCGILSCFLFVIVTIASTSLAGAYALVRGISLFIGHFPNEITIIDQIREGVVPETEWQFWVYLIAILVLFVVSFTFQWRFRPERKGNTKKRNGEYYKI